MKVKFKNISETEKDEFMNSEHLVLAYGVWGENSNVFLIADRELKIIEPFDKNLEIIDKDLSDYENYAQLNYNKDFYVQNDFLNYVRDYESYHDFKIDSIWLKSKLASFFKEKKYLISGDFLETVLNEKYKLGLIKGFITFANRYININSIGSYRNHFYFDKSIDFNSIIADRFKDDEHYKLEQLDIREYKDKLIGFISEKLYFNEEKDILKNKSLIRDFFELIDSLFIDRIQEIYNVKTFYDDMFVIKYKDNFYYLNYDWTS